MIRGITVGMTLGSTDGTTHGTTEVTGADGTIRSTIGDTGAGAAHGTTEAITATTVHIHGILIMRDGTEACILTTDTEVPASEAEATSRRRPCISRDMRLRPIHAYSPTTAGLP